MGGRGLGGSLTGAHQGGVRRSKKRWGGGGNMIDPGKEGGRMQQVKVRRYEKKRRATDLGSRYQCGGSKRRFQRRGDSK